MRFPFRTRPPIPGTEPAQFDTAGAALLELPLDPIHVLDRRWGGCRTAYRL